MNNNECEVNILMNVMFIHEHDGCNTILKVYHFHEFTLILIPLLLTAICQI